MDNTTPNCLYCYRTSDQVPLLHLEFNHQPYWICPQHLPILIHEPRKLGSKLPGVENMPGAEHDHHD